MVGWDGHRGTNGDGGNGAVGYRGSDHRAGVEAMRGRMRDDEHKGWGVVGGWGSFLVVTIFNKFLRLFVRLIFRCVAGRRAQENFQKNTCTCKVLYVRFVLLVPPIVEWHR